ncbi:fungal-specific transcription factor [Penicillium citrinum]|uniref:Fungal-specific transcription factor n=1 Tax=Penicillium citrinum TaxID=5077 RepID=A0A9W9TVC1_PENCI|nr:fungal-specific transcription factor [Penicillium citrinum]KAJ5242064.1 fungal-specific transcription factor [Penicillium citrinum]
MGIFKVVYFEAVHPIYPFLDPQEFRNQISASGLLHSLASDKAFAALYYAVVAIGCQNNDGGTFEAGTGEAWSYFEHLALMAMALYSSTASAFQFEPLFLTGAATMAQGLGFNRLNSESEGTLRCTFLVPHDSNISCSIPDVEESNFEDYDCSAKLGATHQMNLKRDLIRTARSVLELTTFIEVSPSTPIWILAVLPLSCLMIIFDLVVHNPEHPETALSLALLDIAGDHFSRLEFASKGTLPGSLLAKFARLARQYVVNQRQRKRQINQENLSTLSMQSELPSAVRATTLAIENPQIATQHAASDSDEQMLASSQAFLVPESISTPRWNVGSTDDSENQLFIPLIDDPSYRVEDLGLLGIDLKYLFDFPHFNPGTESGM